MDLRPRVSFLILARANRLRLIGVRFRELGFGGWTPINFVKRHFRAKTFLADTNHGCFWNYIRRFGLGGWLPSVSRIRYSRDFGACNPVGFGRRPF